MVRMKDKILPKRAAKKQVCHKPKQAQTEDKWRENASKEGRKEGTCLFDINKKHNTEIYIGKIISGDSH